MVSARHLDGQGSSIAADGEVTYATDRLAFTPEEVATMLGVHVNTVYAQLKSGSLPGLKVGRRWIIPKKHFDTWLDGEGR